MEYSSVKGKVELCVSDYPPEVVDAGKGMSADSLKKKMEDHALIIKTTYWYLLLTLVQQNILSTTPPNFYPVNL